MNSNCNKNEAAPTIRGPKRETESLSRPSEEQRRACHVLRACYVLPVTIAWIACTPLALTPCIHAWIARTPLALTGRIHAWIGCTPLARTERPPLTRHAPHTRSWSAARPRESESVPRRALAQTAIARPTIRRLRCEAPSAALDKVANGADGIERPFGWELEMLEPFVEPFTHVCHLVEYSPTDPRRCIRRRDHLATKRMELSDMGERGVRHMGEMGCLGGEIKDLAPKTELNSEIWGKGGCHIWEKWTLRRSVSTPLCSIIRHVCSPRSASSCFIESLSSCCIHLESIIKLSLSESSSSGSWRQGTEERIVEMDETTHRDPREGKQRRKTETQSSEGQIERGPLCDPLCTKLSVQSMGCATE